MGLPRAVVLREQKFWPDVLLLQPYRLWWVWVKISLRAYPSVYDLTARHILLFRLFRFFSSQHLGRPMRGIISYGGYVPYRRLDRSEITAVMGSGGGAGTRSVASFDEDTTTMGVEAGRLALASSETTPDKLFFSSVSPTYFDRTNATGVHAALRLPLGTSAVDMLGSQRSAIGALDAALDSSSTALVIAADMRTGRPTSGDETAGGDGASALLIGSGDDVIAEDLGGAVATAEFVDRWREPGDATSKLWEERFGEVVYGQLAARAWADALDSCGLQNSDVSIAAVTGLHGRAITRTASKLGVESVADDLTAVIGNTGAAHPGLLLASMLDTANPGDIVALVTYADGVQVRFFRATDAIAGHASKRPVAAQIANAGSVPYAKFLSWRGILEVEPPRRPEPDRPSSSAAYRNEDWKFGLVASRDQESAEMFLPPSRVSPDGGIDQMDRIAMADAVGTISAFTIDKLVYSPSPPVVFGIIDFDGGGRLPIEIADVDADEVKVGDKVEMTFRRLYIGDGISNYFWKARPLR